MTDIGRILYLPPAAANGRSSAIPGNAAADARGQVRAPPPVPAVESGAGGEARAKQFRFRVHDGARSGERPDETLAGDNGLPTRRAGSTLSDEALAARGEPGAGDGRSGRFVASGFGSASAPFLAQLIAQEQLRPGLYDPPLRAADRAYRQAGGQPALAESGRSGHFQIAV